MAFNNNLGAVFFEFVDFKSVNDLGKKVRTVTAVYNIELKPFNNMAVAGEPGGLCGILQNHFPVSAGNESA